LVGGDGEPYRWFGDGGAPSLLGDGRPYRCLGPFWGEALSFLGRGVIVFWAFLGRGPIVFGEFLGERLHRFLGMEFLGRSAIAGWGWAVSLVREGEPYRWEGMGSRIVVFVTQNGLTILVFFSIS